MKDDMPTGTRPPVSRLTRPKKKKGFAMQNGDVDIIRALARFRFLHSGQVQQLIGRSEQVTLRRLQRLFEHGFLDRPECQKTHLTHYFDQGARKLVYALGRQGAKVLARTDGAEHLERINWTLKNDRVDAPHLQHTLESADGVIAFELAARSHKIQLIDQPDLIARAMLPVATLQRSDPFRLRARRVNIKGISKPLDLSVVPDRLISLAFPNGTRSSYSVELDRGEMPVKRRTLEGTSYAKKMLTYFEAWKQDAPEKTWGMKSIRVATVTTSDARLENMIEAQEEITNGGSNLFLFTTLERLKADALGAIWVTGKGETVSLIPEGMS